MSGVYTKQFLARTSPGRRLIDEELVNQLEQQADQLNAENLRLQAIETRLNDCDETFCAHEERFLNQAKILSLCQSALESQRDDISTRVEALLSRVKQVETGLRLHHCDFCAHIYLEDPGKTTAQTICPFHKLTERIDLAATSKEVSGLSDSVNGRLAVADKELKDFVMKYCKDMEQRITDTITKKFDDLNRNVTKIGEKVKQVASRVSTYERKSSEDVFVLSSAVQELSEIQKKAIKRVNDITKVVSHTHITQQEVIEYLVGKFQPERDQRQQLAVNAVNTQNTATVKSPEIEREVNNAREKLKQLYKSRKMDEIMTKSRAASRLEQERKDDKEQLESDTYISNDNCYSRCHNCGCNANEKRKTEEENKRKMEKNDNIVSYVVNNNDIAIMSKTQIEREERNKKTLQEIGPSLKALESALDVETELFTTEIAYPSLNDALKHSKNDITSVVYETNLAMSKIPVPNSNSTLPRQSMEDKRNTIAITATAPSSSSQLSTTAALKTIKKSILTQNNTNKFSLNDEERQKLLKDTTEILSSYGMNPCNTCKDNNIISSTTSTNQIAGLGSISPSSTSNSSNLLASMNICSGPNTPTRPAATKAYAAVSSQDASTKEDNIITPSNNSTSDCVVTTNKTLKKTLQTLQTEIEKEEKKRKRPILEGQLANQKRENYSIEKPKSRCASTSSGNAKGVKKN